MPNITDALKMAKIAEIDAKFFGQSELEMVTNAGKAIASEILDILDNFIQKDKLTKVSFVIGSGNNGADALSCLNHLIGKNIENVEYHVYVIGRHQDFKTKEIIHQYDLLKELIKNNKGSKVVINHDAYAENMISCDILIEGLIGSGYRGKLRKRYKDVVNKIARLKAYKVAIDSPVPGYRPDVTLSLITKKRADAKLIDISLPKEVGSFVGPGVISFLNVPEKDAYKSKTGELLIIGGSDLFHGAPIMALKAASKFIGGVFFYTHPENRELVTSLKLGLEEFILLTNDQVEKYSNYADVILAGPGLREDLVNQAVLTELLNRYPDKVFVLDAYAIAMANPVNNPRNIRGYNNCILTPHRGELRHIFGKNETDGLEGKLKRFCVENKCMLVLKGSTDLLFNDKGELKMNMTGNQGMAKGGTGDVMAGMIGALACKNDPWEALQAGVFLSGLAGDIAKAKYGYNFSATDEIPLLQEAYKRALDYK